MSNFEIITDVERLLQVCNILASQEVVGFDIETTSLNPRRGEIRLMQFSTGSTTYVVDVRKVSKNSLDLLTSLLETDRPVKVIHNAKFDAKWVRHHLGCEVNGIFDTYLMSQLAAAGDKSKRHGLAAVTEEFMGMTLDKSEQASDWYASELSTEQVEYAAKDAEVLPKLYRRMHARLDKDKLLEVAEIENLCVMPIVDMELNGFHLDPVKWTAQIKAVEAAQVQVEAELKEMLSPGSFYVPMFPPVDINLDSIKQVSDCMKNLGIPLPETTREWQIKPLASEYPVVDKLLDYRGLAKALNSYGYGVLEYIDPATGRIHADFRQMGADTTGRFSCSNFNLQQIPHDDAYRSCFTAPPGRKLVVADYSQIELRILADFSEDKEFIAAFKSGEDFHTKTAMLVFGDPLQRSFAKQLNFGMVYGVGVSRFSTITGLSLKDAGGLMNKYFATFSGLDTYIKDSGRQAVANCRSRTASGRLLELKFDRDDKGSIAAARRNGVNMPIQGTSADILKIALRLLHDATKGTSARLVNIVHDEIVVECDDDESQKIAKTLEEVMIAAAERYVKRVPVKVEATIAEAWKKG